MKIVKNHVIFYAVRVYVRVFESKYTINRKLKLITDS